MLLMISLKLKPLLSKGILIAFSKSTGGKGEGEGERVAYQQAAATSQQGYWMVSLLSSPCWKEQHANNVEGYACFSIGFVSVVPVKTRGISFSSGWMKGREPRDEIMLGKKLSFRILVVKWLGEHSHHTAGFGMSVWRIGKLTPAGGQEEQFSSQIQTLNSPASKIWACTCSSGTYLYCLFFSPFIDMHHGSMVIIAYWAPDQFCSSLAKLHDVIHAQSHQA